MNRLEAMRVLPAVTDSGSLSAERAAAPKAKCPSANTKEYDETRCQKQLEIIARVKDRAIGSKAERFIKKFEVDRTTVQCAICERY
jgi:hypothetical protein